MKWSVIFLICLLLISIVSAETYFYAGGTKLASKGVDSVEFHYNDRLGSDIESDSLPFGQVIMSGERFDFTGKEQDASSLHYFGARYYDSSLARFSSVDPVEDGNDYAYVGNNPLNVIDPSGMFGVNLVNPSDNSLGVPQSQIRQQSKEFQDSYHAGSTIGNTMYTVTGLAVMGGYVLGGAVATSGGWLLFLRQNTNTVIELGEEVINAALGLDSPTSLSGAAADAASSIRRGGVVDEIVEEFAVAANRLGGGSYGEVFAFGDDMVIKVAYTRDTELKYANYAMLDEIVALRILSDQGVAAERTLLGMTSDGRVVTLQQRLDTPMPDSSEIEDLYAIIDRTIFERRIVDIKDENLGIDPKTGLAKVLDANTEYGRDKVWTRNID